MLAFSDGFSRRYRNSDFSAIFTAKNKIVDQYDGLIKGFKLVDNQGCHRLKVKVAVEDCSRIVSSAGDGPLVQDLTS